MAELMLEGVTFAGETRSFPAVTDLLLESKRHSPADRLTVELCEDLKSVRFAALTVRAFGETLFTGFVDTQTRVVDERGIHSTLVARSFPARMLDHEIKPGTYQNLSSTQLYQKYAKPYGVTGVQFPKKVVVRELIAEKGTSIWAFIRQFCKLAYGQSVYLNRERKLTLSPYTGKSHVFGSFGVPFTSLSLKEDRYSMISTLYIKTADTANGAYYGRVLKNGVAQQFQVERVRYYHPERIWENDVSLAGRDVLRERQLDYLEATLELAGLQNIRVGDTAMIRDASGGYSGLYVAEVRFRQNESGAYTRVKCWDRQILKEG